MYVERTGDIRNALSLQNFGLEYLNVKDRLATTTTLKETEFIWLIRTTGSHLSTQQ